MARTIAIIRLFYLVCFYSSVRDCVYELEERFPLLIPPPIEINTMQQITKNIPTKSKTVSLYFSIK